MMIELLGNPVTIIAGILSVFFLAMGVARRAARRRADAGMANPDDARYQIYDPYKTPAGTEATASVEPPPPTPGLDEPTPPPPQPAGSLFKEYRPAAQAANDASVDTDGYVWE